MIFIKCFLKRFMPPLNGDLVMLVSTFTNSEKDNLVCSVKTSNVKIDFALTLKTIFSIFSRTNKTFYSTKKF